MRGRPPKPNRIKKLTGSRHVNEGEPQPEPGAPEMPYGFKTRHPKAAKFWAELAPIMAQLKVLTEADSPTWHLMSLHYEIALQAVELIREDGLTRRDEANVERKHPALQILRDNSKLFMQYSDRLGLSASARARLSVDMENQGADELEQFLMRAAAVARAKQE